MTSISKSASNSGGSSSASSPGASVQEFSIRVPKNMMVSHNVMQFYSANIDFTKWSQVKMERENNLKEFRGADEEQPKFGAGSEFGREAREEARRKKYGIITKKYRPEDQPWILKIGGKTGKKFRGVRGGGVGENASYYVFTHAPDGAIDAFPIQEWYNFQPIQRYKALTAEEAEEEFGRRNKSWNLFSVMMRKRLNGGEDIDGEDVEEGKSKKSSNKKKDLKISEMDDWVDSDDDSESNSDAEEKEEKEETDRKKSKKNGKNEVKKKKKKKDSDDEAFEESDDGDEEGRELDYITDSSESEVDHDEKAVKEMQGVAEEDALRKLLSSGEEDEEEKQDKEEKEKESGEEEKNGEKAVDKDKSVGSAKKKKKKKLTKKLSKKDDTQGSSTDSSPDSSDSEAEVKKKSKSKEAPNSAGSSRSATPTSDTASPDSKRKNTTQSDGPAAKKPRLESNLWGDSGITEDAVRRYLMRKPMTTTELLQKFKSKKTGLTSDQLVNVMTQILKRINPVRQTIKGKMYLSIKG